MLNLVFIALSCGGKREREKKQTKINLSENKGKDVSHNLELFFFYHTSVKI
jgi:hypothetical protein